MNFDYSFLDSLIFQKRSFSIYRLPNSCEIVFMMQKEGEIKSRFHLSELNGQEGFVMVPFLVSPQKPIVLIHPEIILEGEAKIFDFLAKTTEKLPAQNQASSFVQKSDTETYSEYEKVFELFKSALCSNTCKKIVLSRTYTIRRLESFSPGKAFRSACKKYPDAFVYLCHTPLTGTWFGSSPELILSADGKKGQTVALAGTKKASGKSMGQEWDEKNIKEQQIVSEYIEELLKEKDITYYKEGPYTIRAGKLMHLKTTFNFQMKDKYKLGDLLESLHPTPAVCGFPKQEAYRLIIEKEGYDRSYYSGFTGPFSSSGNTHLFVNLRCMKIDPESLTFFAGGGLLASSELENEWEETKDKLKTMLSLVKFEK